MSQILRPVSFGGIVRPNPPHVVIQGVRRVKRRIPVSLAEPLSPVLALLLLDLETGSVGEGAEVGGVHRGSLAYFRASLPST